MHCRFIRNFLKRMSAGECRKFWRKIANSVASSSKEFIEITVFLKAMVLLDLFISSLDLDKTFVKCSKYIQKESLIDFIYKGVV